MKKWKRPDRKSVVKNASDNKTGAFSWLRLPKGVAEWHPEKAGSVKLDVLPYIVKGKHHPDRVEPGAMWYKYPFSVHRSVGVNSEQRVCPLSIGKPCPICEEKSRLAKNWEKHKQMIRELTPQKFVAYNIIDPEDPDKVSVFVFSRYKFAEQLENELIEGDEENAMFFDTREGKTLKVRFSDEEFEGRGYLKATRIDFMDRKRMNEEEVLESVVCLDTILIVDDYDSLKKEFMGESDHSDDDEPRKKKDRFGSRSSSDEDDEDDEDMGTDEDEDETEDDDEDMDSEDEDEDEEDEDEDEDDEPVGKKKKAKRRRDEDEDEDEDDEPVAMKSKRRRDEDDEEEDDEPVAKKSKRRRDEDEDDEDDDEPSFGRKKKVKSRRDEDDDE